MQRYRTRITAGTERRAKTLSLSQPLGVLTLSTAACFSSLTSQAYTQGKGKTAEVGSGEVIRKIDEVTSPNLSDPITGEFDRSGDPVRIIWYEDDIQHSADNRGRIHGGIKATGKTTNQTDEKAGSLTIDAQGNGIDALGWSAPSNNNDIDFTIKSVKNTGAIQAEASLKGGQAETHGAVETYAVANGISVVGLADFGNAIGVDGVSGASGSSKSRKASGSTSSGGGGSGGTADFSGKDVKVALEKVNNNHGKIAAQFSAAGYSLATPYTANYKPQFYSVTANASGNGVSVSSYVSTVDPYTFSEDRINQSKFGALRNIGGYIVGNADLRGGVNTTHTYTKSYSTGNGLSVSAATARFAKNSTYATIDSVTNEGELSGSLTSLAGNNSRVRSIMLFSKAEAWSSGNGISAHADTLNAQTQFTEAKIGSVDNSGRIRGDALLRAGNGYGDIGVKAEATGNGVVAYLHAASSTPTASIGAIDNAGIISGRVETHAGIVPSNVPIPDQKVKLTIGYYSTFTYPSQLPPKPAGYTSNLPFGLNINASNEVYASGNGIVAWAKDKTDKAALGNINNAGVISGYAALYHGFTSAYKRIDFLAAGSGIAVNGAMNNDVINAGIISGNQTALLASGKVDGTYDNFNPDLISHIKGKVENYGIMAGKLILANYDRTAGNDYSLNQSYTYFEGDRLAPGAAGLPKVKNAGIHIRLNDDESIKEIKAGTDNPNYTGKDGTVYSVINAPIAADKKNSELLADQSSYSKVIINGAGMDKGALVGNGDLALSSAIINGYRTALYLGTDGNKVLLKDSSVNVNGFKANSLKNNYAIWSAANNSELTLAGKTIVNGDIYASGSGSKTTIADAKVRINGALDLGGGELNFGALSRRGSVAADKPIRVTYNVKNANLNINAPTQVASWTKFSGVNEITLNSDLIYGVDTPEQHPLYDAERTQKVTLKGASDKSGYFIVDISRLKDTTATLKHEIGFGGYALEDDGKVQYKTTSIIQMAELKNGKLIIKPKEVDTGGGTGGSGGSGSSTAKRLLPTRYPSVYKSFIQGNHTFLATSASTTDKSEQAAINALDHYFQQVADKNIYGAVGAAGQRSVSTYRRTALGLSNQIQPQGQMSVGSFTEGMRRISSMMGYTFADKTLGVNDTLAQDEEIYGELAAKTEHMKYRDTAAGSISNIALTSISYGVTQNMTIGMALGKGTEHIDGFYGSNLQGDSVFVSAFSAHALSQALTVTAGLAYDQINLTGTRHITNGYDSHNFKVSLQPKILNAYSQLQYAIPLSGAWQIKPAAVLAYNQIRHGGIHETDVAGLEIEQRNYQALDYTAGISAVGSFTDLQVKLSADYMYSDAGSDPLRGSFHNGSSFDISSEKGQNTVMLGMESRYKFSKNIGLHLGLDGLHNTTSNVLGWTANAGVYYRFK